jgi:putative Ca2+/H+ antiporter (TMEM165/GDT1 family)
MFAAFTAGLLLITISELGDKTFFIAVILAMRHSRRLVLAGVVAALAAMTFLSVLLGQAVALLPQTYVNFTEIALFLGFGFKLLYDASHMSAQACSTDEHKEALEVVEQCKSKLQQKNSWVILLQAFTLTFLAEWGDRTQITTITLAAANHPVGVTLGAILGHTVCAAIAVLGGRMIAGRISERTITAIGGALFILFGCMAAILPD